MKIECPTCRKISRLTGELLLTRSEGLEVECPKCKTHIKLYVLAKSGKDGPLQTSYDPFEDQIGPLVVDSDKQTGNPALKTKILRSLVNLPPMPHIILRAKEIMDDPDSSLREWCQWYGFFHPACFRIAGSKNLGGADNDFRVIKAFKQTVERL
jgi:hypothetical protein